MARGVTPPPSPRPQDDLASSVRVSRPSQQSLFIKKFRRDRTPPPPDPQRLPRITSCQAASLAPHLQTPPQPPPLCCATHYRFRRHIHLRIRSSIPRYSHCPTSAPRFHSRGSGPSQENAIALERAASIMPYPLQNRNFAQSLSIARRPFSRLEPQECWDPPHPSKTVLLRPCNAPQTPTVAIYDIWWIFQHAPDGNGLSRITSREEPCQRGVVLL